MKVNERYFSYNKLKKGMMVLLAAVCTILGCTACSDNAAKEEMEKNKALLAQETIYPGVTVADLDVSGKTVDAAAAMLQAQLKEKGSVLQLVYEDKVWELTFEELGVTYDPKVSAEEAYSLGRTGTDKERLEAIGHLAAEGKNVPLSFTLNTEVLSAALEEIAPEVNREPEKLTISMAENGEEVVVTEGKAGVTLDMTGSLAEAARVLGTLKENKVVLAVVESDSAVSSELFDFPLSRIGSFYTNYTGGETLGRNINLRVGCAAINGTVLLPGEEFSANDILGEQTYENGYRMAAVIMDGKLEQGMGGGVCQITSTLYNAAIRAELQITERHNHSLAVAYIPTGLDAAVAGTYKNLRFVNSTEYPVYIEAYSGNGVLMTNIYGYEEHEPNRKIEFERVYAATYPKPEEKITEDPERYTDEREVTYEGKTGFKIQVYKNVYAGDELVSRDWFSDSVYRPVADEVTVGTKVREGYDLPPLGSDDIVPEEPLPGAEDEAEQEEGNADTEGGFADVQDPAASEDGENTPEDDLAEEEAPITEGE